MSRSSNFRTFAKLFTPVTKRYVGARLNHMLPLSSQEFFVEDTLQGGWPQFHGRLQGLATDGIADCLPGVFSDQPFRVISFMQRQARDATTILETTAAKKSPGSGQSGRSRFPVRKGGAQV